ncbi:uncharacterized protein Fot_02569 [Forsythia ovata]|uniref:Transposase n=1 Tax=Forsythia ovata TaxID=205694 RepID=A0ABD1X840_9LAMI
MTRAASLHKPYYIDSIEEWQAFVKERNSQPYKEKNDRFKKMRASQTLMHTTSRKGSFYHMQVVATKKLKAYSEIFNSPNKHSLKDNGVARVLGPERQGSIRGIGFGATPSKLNALVHNHSLQTQVQESRNEIKELQALFQVKNRSIEEGDNVSGKPNIS